MYPAEGKEPPRVMTWWETQNCPWYMDTPLWADPFNQFKRNARKTVDAKLIPSAVFNGVKEGLEDDAKQLAQNVMDTAVNTRFYADQSPKQGLKKAKEEMEQKPTSSKQSKFSLSDASDVASVNYACCCLTLAIIASIIYTL
jgi:hypothetical protein